MGYEVIYIPKCIIETAASESKTYIFKGEGAEKRPLYTPVRRGQKSISFPQISTALKNDSYRVRRWVNEIYALFLLRLI